MAYSAVCQGHYRSPCVRCQVTAAKHTAQITVTTRICGVPINIYSNIAVNGSAGVVTAKHTVNVTAAYVQCYVTVNISRICTAINITYTFSVATGAYYVNSACITGSLITASIELCNMHLARCITFLNCNAYAARNVTHAVASAEYLIDGTAGNGYCNIAVYIGRCGRLCILVTVSAAKHHSGYSAAMYGYAGAIYIGCITAAIYIGNAGVALVYYQHCGSSGYSSSITTAIDITAYNCSVCSCGITNSDCGVTGNHCSSTQATSKYVAGYRTILDVNRRTASVSSLVTTSKHVTHVPFIGTGSAVILFNVYGNCTVYCTAGVVTAKYVGHYTAGYIDFNI